MSVGSPFFWLFAFGAGMISFTSPCCLPLLPGYLSYVSGVSGDDIGHARERVLPACLLFVAGFTLVFSALGATASILGSLFLANRALLLQASGFFVIAMGLVTFGVLRLPMLYAERRFHLKPARGPWGALPLGMAFAFGWTPCVGPVLAAILTVAGAQGSVRLGAGLLAIYALGLGVPFVALGLFTARGLTASRWLRRHGRLLSMLGGTVLVAMGTLLVTNQWLRLMAPLLRLDARLNWPPF
ncbi:MAG TPA: cytochrome c biogenesis protein CcdA [Chloroflexota bacterium]|nr:cytochrome c biogenesis protein CcdA [Chloroflexota bacterium]